MDKLNDIIKQDPLKACEGCVKAAAYDKSGLFCPLYTDPSLVYSIRVHGICPHNAPEKLMTEKIKQKVRAGQQKQKSKKK